jgi:hypothetical protein
MVDTRMAECKQYAAELAKEDNNPMASMLVSGACRG